MTSADLSSSPDHRLPMLLADLHRGCLPGAVVHARLPDAETIHRQRFVDIIEGAGFTASRRGAVRPTRLVRQYTLPDTVSVDMNLLVCGLNPSPAAADAGVGFARPGNRFWPAALDAGLASADRDPDHALIVHGMGMTDLVKRTTRRADELGPSEFEDGLARVERLVQWLRPGAICFVGLAGWRIARDRRAKPGWQSEPLGTTRVYLMPSTSGLNASSQLPDLTEHLAAAATG